MKLKLSNRRSLSLEYSLTATKSDTYLLFFKAFAIWTFIGHISDFYVTARAPTTNPLISLQTAVVNVVMIPYTAVTQEFDDNTGSTLHTITFSLCFSTKLYSIFLVTVTFIMAKTVYHCVTSTFFLCVCWSLQLRLQSDSDCV